MTAATFDPWTAVTDSLTFLKENYRRVAIWGLLMYVPVVFILLAFMPIFLAAAAAGASGGTPEDLGLGTSLAVNAVSGLGNVLQVVAAIPIYVAVGFMMWGRTRTKTWLGLRIGMDEVRVFLVYLGMIAAICIGFMVAAVVIGLIVVPLGYVSKVAGALVAVPLVLAAIAATIWVGIRASLIIPATLDKGNFAFVEGWQATKGRFWPLLGAGLLAFLMMLLIAVVFVVVIMIIALIAMLIVGAATGWSFDLAPGTILALTIPGLVVYFVAMAVLAGAQVVLTMGPWYSIWKQLNHNGSAPVAQQPEHDAQL